jgi:hypothetical protein
MAATATFRRTCAESAQRPRGGPDGVPRILPREPFWLCQRPRLHMAGALHREFFRDILRETVGRCTSELPQLVIKLSARYPGQGVRNDSVLPFRFLSATVPIQYRVTDRIKAPVLLWRWDKGPPMLPQDPAAGSVWRLLEELYLDAADKPAASKYADLSETEKHSILLAFADAQAATSKRWATIAGDLRSIGLTG